MNSSSSTVRGLSVARDSWAAGLVLVDADRPRGSVSADESRRDAALTDHRPTSAESGGHCDHYPQCPAAEAPDRTAARILVTHPEQGWSQLCNRVVLFDDTGELLPDGGTVDPHRPTDDPLAS